MPDKETLTQNGPSKLTEDQTPSDTNAEKKKTTTAGVKTTGKKTVAEPLSSKKGSIKKTVTNKNVANTHPTTPISKLALLAIFIAAGAVVASVGNFTWQQKQNLALTQALNEQRQLDITASQNNIKEALGAAFSLQLKQQLAQQQKTFAQQLKQVAQQAHLENEGSVSQLSAQVQQLEQSITQRQPSDWLIHEAEYLIRIAARTMWLERDTTAAIGLLKEANIRLSELKQPKFLPIRALINQDIAKLALMPKLENQQAILSLMALNKQVNHLPVAGVNVNETVEHSSQDNFELSSDINDWQTNLKKTWNKFLNDFITVRRRTGTVEPLMTPEQQQNLKQNLSLKIQLVQWAASEQKTDIFQQNLVDIQAWMKEFFDMKSDVNQRFYQSVEKVKQHTVHFDYPSDLSSLTAIKLLSNEADNDGKPAFEAEEFHEENEPTEQINKSVEVSKPGIESERGEL